MVAILGNSGYLTAMIENRAVATGTSFLGMFFLGIGVAIIGATARSVGYTAAQIGYLVSAQNIGFGVSVLVAGALSDIFSKPKILAVGCAILAASFAVLYRSDVYAVNMLVMAGTGVGMGAAEAVTDALLMDIHDKNESRYITINHFFVSIGSVVITLYLMFLRMNWMASLTQVAIGLAVLAVVCLFLRPRGKKRGAITAGEIISVLGKNRAIVLLFITASCAIGLGAGSMAMITTYLSVLRGTSDEIAQIGLALFLIGLATGRIVLGLVSRHDSLEKTVAFSFAAATIVVGGFFLVPLPVAVALPIAFLGGLTVAPLLPLSIALAGLMFRRIAGTAMGVVKVAIPVGGIVVPAVLAFVADTVSFAASLYVFPVIGLLGVLGIVASGATREDRT